MARPRKNPLTVDKICPTCKKTFTLSYRKIRQIFCSKTCAQHSPEVLKKMEESKQKTYNEKWGGLHPMETENTKNAFKKSIFEKYGNDYFSNYLVKKTKETKKEKYGDENYNNIEQMKKTCLEKYGVDNARKSQMIIEKCNTTVKKKHYDYLIEYYKTKNISPMFSELEYTGCNFSKKYKFKCLKCNSEFESDVYKPQNVFCELCNPTDNDTLENEIFKYVSSLLSNDIIIKRNDRTILLGKEIDIYIPSLKIGIEINGLYWHSEDGRGIGKYYHLNKYKSTLFHGIQLIHIFENEWIYKNEIIKSILKNILKSKLNKIYARNCIIKSITDIEKDNFLNDNHLQGKDLSPIKYGLFYKNELVSVMTFGKSRFDKKVEWEMIRYCSKLSYSIIGGASKLFSYFLKNKNPNSVISYSDKRFFSGNVYINLGFKFNSNTPPNYYYISKNYKTLYNRMGFQKHKLSKLLENFDPNLTEWENMKNNGFDRIWDCGHSKWIFRSNDIKKTIKEI